MRKMMWLATSAVVASVAVAAGGTYALFRAATAPAINTFTAGTLCLASDRNDGDRVPGPMFYVTPQQGATPAGKNGLYPTGPWAPGDTNARTLTLNNPESCSSMDAWLTSVHASVHAGGYAPMADKLWVEIWTPEGGAEAKVGEGWLSQFLDPLHPVPISYPGGSKIPLYLTSNRHMKFKVTFDRSADNSYQDKSLVVDFTVNAVQQNNNP